MTLEVYNKSVDILLDAYNKGQLLHGFCTACAVGNLVAANMGYELNSDMYWINANPIWYDSIMNGIKYYEPKGECKVQIDSTGIHVDELALIEGAFEGADSNDGNQLQGLKAVLNLMRTLVQEPTEDRTEDLNEIARRRGQLV